MYSSDESSTADEIPKPEGLDLDDMPSEVMKVRLVELSHWMAEIRRSWLFAQSADQSDANGTSSTDVEPESFVTRALPGLS